MSWDLFLIEKLLKSEIYESMNSARVHCSQLTWSNSAAGKKQNQKTQPKIQRKTLNPNGHIDLLSHSILRNQITFLNFMCLNYSLNFIVINYESIYLYYLF